MSKEFVIIESPYAGDVEENVKYGRSCLRDSIMRGEVPFASHLLYTQEGVLDDNDAHERDLGIELGLSLGQVATKTAVYIDRGISSGMEYGIKRAVLENRDVEFRSINDGRLAVSFGLSENWLSGVDSNQPS